MPVTSPTPSNPGTYPVHSLGPALPRPFARAVAFVVLTVLTLAVGVGAPSTARAATEEVPTFTFTWTDTTVRVGEPVRVTVTIDWPDSYQHDQHGWPPFLAAVASDCYGPGGLDGPPFKSWINWDDRAVHSHTFTLPTEAAATCQFRAVGSATDWDNVKYRDEETRAVTSSAHPTGVTATWPTQKAVRQGTTLTVTGNLTWTRVTGSGSAARRPVHVQHHTRTGWETIAKTIVDAANGPRVHVAPVRHPDPARTGPGDDHASAGHCAGHEEGDRPVLTQVCARRARP